LAVLRDREGKLWYDYWELTGAKMWITNGRMAGIMALYAKTPDGVTGFIVDRHAEGLIVGKDEAKMGQNGSPTNELSLQAVRVPRENVIGLEGRGQVNALETLNVGRAGLAMSCMAQMRGLIEASRDFALQCDGSIEPCVAERLVEMEQERFIAEAIAFEVIGRFEHSQTKSVRMESAIAKMLASELLHHTIELAEEIHGLDGQTQRHLVEKRKRDARILNISEGTTEVQRFTILKDLVAEVAPRWPDSEPASRELASDAPQAERHRLRLEALAKEAIAVWGQDVWQNPNFQPSCFLLAEAAAWIKASDAASARLTWLLRYASSSGDSGAETAIDAGRRAIARCDREARDRLDRFRAELGQMRAGRYSPEIRAGSLLLQAAPASVPAPVSARDAPVNITASLRILVLVEPSIGRVPRVDLVQGMLAHPWLCLSDASRSAVEAALRLHDGAPALVSVSVIGIGPRRFAHPLRDIAGLGIQCVQLIASTTDTFPTTAAVEAIARILGDRVADLVLVGTGADEEGVVGTVAAAAHGIVSRCRGTEIQLCNEGKRRCLTVESGGHFRTINLPAAVEIVAGLELRDARIDELVEGFGHEVTIHELTGEVDSSFLAPANAAPPPLNGSRNDVPSALSPDRAASELLALLGKEGEDSLAPYAGTIRTLRSPPTQRLSAGSRDVVSVVWSGDGRLDRGAKSALQAAQMLARGVDGRSIALIVTPGDEGAQRLAVAHAGGDVDELFILALPQSVASTEIAALLLHDHLSLWDPKPAVMVAEAWAESTIVRRAIATSNPAQLILRVRALALERDRIIAETLRDLGRLQVCRALKLPSDGTLWLTLTEDTAVRMDEGLSPNRALESRTVSRWALPEDVVSRDAEAAALLADLKAAAGITRLTDADYIIDVGFGVGNRDGYEAAIEPLERALRGLGIENVMVGGSRKVTEELHLLPVDRQIGQSGVSVNPQIMLAIGVSGAPQHLNYIGPRAVIVAFNRDPEAPLMTLNQRQSKPRVLPVVGDLFQTVPAFIRARHSEVQTRERSSAIPSAEGTRSTPNRFLNEAGERDSQ
jgi:electron transfer flavoprotein alpha subunit